MRASRGLFARCLMFAVALALVWACASTPSRSTPAGGVSPLSAYYAQKYPEWQKRLVAAGVDELFAHAGKAERRQAVLETLAYFHVVYHPTRSHRIQNNLAVVQQYGDEIRLACERFGVPQGMAFAILTWENSGGTSATSYAACVGMGQLSDGALAQAHRVSMRFARVDLAAQGFCILLANVVDTIAGPSAVARALRSRADFLAHRGLEMNLGAVHADLARTTGVKDERAIPRANIEDSVVYMRYLLEMYGGRADIAISAYHNGVGNTDDLLRDYLRRVDAAAATAFDLRHRAPLLAAMQRHHISYVTLWNDVRCHQMLNGLRTMDGDITTAGNAREAMGDESDIYVWKTLGALGGTRATAAQVDAICARYALPQGEAETLGFTPGRDLVEARGFLATRELHGYLRALERRVRALGRKGAAVPALVMSAAHDSETHRSGLAVDLAVNNPLLARLLNEDWLFDRIYKTRLPDGRVHICLNPRYGAEFLARFEASGRSASASAAR